MRHAFVMDPLETVKPHKDTTYFLMLAAAQRGHQVGYVSPHDIRLEHQHPHAQVTWVEVAEVSNNNDRPFVVKKTVDCALSEMDVIWIRQDPPFDRRYFYITLFLDYLPSSTRVVNRPSGVRNWNEKLAALHYPNFTPRTLISNKANEIKKFSETVGRVTIKPVDGFGGKGIVFYHAGKLDGDDIGDDGLKTATANDSHWVIVQEYLPAAKHGDKRVLLLNGEPLGAILRVHADGVELNNLDAGGVAQPSELTPRELEICAALKDGLIEQGILFAGIDFIGEQLIEINVTSPTGLQELCRFTGEDYHHQIIAALE